MAANWRYDWHDERGEGITQLKRNQSALTDKAAIFHVHKASHSCHCETASRVAVIIAIELKSLIQNLQLSPSSETEAIAQNATKQCKACACRKPGKYGIIGTIRFLLCHSASSSDSSTTPSLPRPWSGQLPSHCDRDDTSSRPCSCLRRARSPGLC